ncbi:unnamed protein product [Closterium sp. NIES-65]|nr:unnamed protein product [Closterium sp. NIES-65]
MPGKDVDAPAAEPMETSSAGAGSGAQEARKGKKKKKAQQGEGGSGSLPPHLEELRSRVICDMDAPKQVRGGGGMGGVEGGRVARKVQWLRVRGREACVRQNDRWEGRWRETGKGLGKIEGSWHSGEQIWRRGVAGEPRGRGTCGAGEMAPWMLVLMLMLAPPFPPSHFRLRFHDPPSRSAFPLPPFVLLIIPYHLLPPFAPPPSPLLQTHALQYSGAFAALGVDNSMTLERFRRELTVEIVSQSADGHDLVFDLVGIDAALANAFRRILIAEVPTMAIEKVLMANNTSLVQDEVLSCVSVLLPHCPVLPLAFPPPLMQVPTMAIEKVFMANNTSLVQDEVLSHRLGLVPIAVDPRLFDFPSEDGMASESNTIVFKLDYKCTRNPPADGSRHGTVQSKHLVWQPNGSTYPPDRPTKFTSFGRPQSELHDFATRPPAPTYPDITLARLRPGQAIELEAHAVKGIGRTHAKWSPVATASYRMLPEVSPTACCQSGPLVGGRMAAAVGHWLEGGWLRQWAIGGRMAAAVGHWLEGGWLRQWAIGGRMAAAVGHWRADGCGSGPLEGGWLRQWAIGGRMAAAVGHWRADGCGSGPLEGGWLRQWAIGWRADGCGSGPLEGGWLRQWAIGGRMAAAVGHWRADGCGSGPLEGGWLRQWAIGGRMAAAVGHWLEGGWLRQWAIGGRMAAAVGHWLEGGWLRQWAIGWRADGCGSGPLVGGRMAAAVGHWLEGGWLRQWAIGGRMAAAVGHWMEGGWVVFVLRKAVEGQMVVFRKAVEGEMAEQLVAKCPMNVFDIEDMGNGIQRATAPRARNCTVCRECIREEGWGDYIQLRRKRDHFIFSVMSMGALPPNVLFTDAFNLLEGIPTFPFLSFLRFRPPSHSSHLPFTTHHSLSGEHGSTAPQRALHRGSQAAGEQGQAPCH